MVFHVDERIKVEITVEVYIRSENFKTIVLRSSQWEDSLYTPVPAVFLH
jgi:hypothetical protein